MPEEEHALLDNLRALLCALQDQIRLDLERARASQQTSDLAAVAHESSADTIYGIDKVSEDAILTWFAANWPPSEPVELVMEGIEEEENPTFPVSTPVANTKWKCILDPIDGTRGIMYDKRSAWSLAGLAPQKGEATRLSDICVAAMTELPTSKAYLADQVSGVRGCGRDGLVCQRINILDGSRTKWTPQPSTARDFRHGFAAWARFFPEGKALLAEMEEQLWDELVGLNSSRSPVIFDDQYIATAGQLFEILVGHDRMQGDLRPLAHKKLGFESSLVCHPYDICTAFLLEEAGGIIETPEGGRVDAPLDTTSSLTWIAFANEQLASQVRPVLHRLMEEYLL